MLALFAEVECLLLFPLKYGNRVDHFSAVMGVRFVFW